MSASVEACAAMSRGTHSDTTDVCKDIIGDDQAHRQEEPDQALKNVVHDEMCLHDDEVQSHVGPRKLCKLKFVVAFLERHDEEHKACGISTLARSTIDTSNSPIT